MAVVKGVKEKVHLPLYDSIVVKAKEQLVKTQSSNVLRFFQDVTGKTKLQTNMQAASLLPHWNTFEARALRVVISDLAAQFPDSPLASIEFKGISTILASAPTDAAVNRDILLSLNLRNFVDLKRRVEGPAGASLPLSQDELDALGLKLTFSGNPVLLASTTGSTTTLTIDRSVLKDAENRLEQQLNRSTPPPEQIFPNDGFGNVIGKFIYNTVTTFFVGEKIMIQVPTWFFPAGAGPYSEDGKVTTHGYPSPQATFRFAEPIFIDTQQNFRVEIEIPEGEVLGDLQKLYGPLFIWVVIDGFMTRDVQ